MIKPHLWVPENHNAPDSNWMSIPHAGVFDDGRVGRGQPAEGWEALSGKFAFVADMLHVLWTRTRDKIVIVSNYTQTLDLMTTLCRARNYPCVRLDGSTTIKNRQKMVRTFTVNCLCELGRCHWE